MFYLEAFVSTIGWGSSPVWALLLVLHINFITYSPVSNVERNSSSVRQSSEQKITTVEDHLLLITPSFHWFTTLFATSTYVYLSHGSKAVACVLLELLMLWWWGQCGDHLRWPLRHRSNVLKWINSLLNTRSIQKETVFEIQYQSGVDFRQQI